MGMTGSTITHNCVKSFMGDPLPGLLLHIEEGEEGIRDRSYPDENLQILFEQLSTLLEYLVTRVPEFFRRKLGSSVRPTQLKSE